MREPEEDKSTRRGGQSRRWRRRLPRTLENEEDADAMAVATAVAIVLTDASAKKMASQVATANA